ncbi:transport and Golgi organization protein 6 homolog [Gouania willdenowi]|uniref:Transport and Golgi organization protein 6 homolog n=1 Tax=Gouania willdenowi TaxID=441366 RepID=A0A8C5D2F8_GOUWI|nr:transport and Golgi organization protein 6 homolog [Gouania willdenowi]
MTSAIISAINVLVRPLNEASAQPSQQGALLVALKANRASLLERLHGDGSFEVVRRLREEVSAAASKEWLCSDAAEDVVWCFVQECLLLLLTLKQHLSNELHRFQQATPPTSATRCTPEMAPPLPPDVLSVAQQKTVRAALQFVVCLGLCPYLAPGVGVPLGRRSAFGATVENVVKEGAGPTAGRRLLVTTNALLQVAEISSLATLVFTQNLSDVLAALCQLGHQSLREDQKPLSADERRSCRQALKSLLGKVYQPIVIKELLILQGGPKQSSPVGGGVGASSRAGLTSAPAWLRRLCGQLLSERLMQPKGLQAVVRAILEGGTGGESDWKKCDAVARILVACPQQSTSPDDYFRLVCPQILDLLHFKDKLTALQFQRVATRAALCMLAERPSFAHQYLLSPVLAPLHRCASMSDDSQDFISESELTQSIEDVYKLWVVGNSPSTPLIDALKEVLPVIFSLFCFTKKNASHLRAPCQEIVLWYLSHTDSPAALWALRGLSGLLGGKRSVAAGFHFSPGSDGGARLSRMESCSDEDDDLYEKLSEEQWHVECLIQLLSELKDSDLPGDFFLVLLQELTSLAEAADGDEAVRNTPDVSAMTLLEAEQHVQGRTETQSRRLAVLQVLAVMVESLQHSQLLRNSSQVVDFMVSLFQRACVGLNRVYGPNDGNPIESQTLSMGMGLLATMLSEPQLSSEDYSSMSRLLTPLETLSKRHSDVLIQELASNLRAVIATHGAYCPENISAAKAPPAHSETTTTSKSNSSHSTNRIPGSSAASSRPLSDWLMETCDPDVPTRVFALRTLTQLVLNKDSKTVQAQEKVLTVFLENLEHEDSFVYLSAIHGLAALAESHPDRIIERLLKDFQHGSSNKERSLETRLKVGEVLMRASRAMGELAPHLGRPLLGVFLRGTRDSDPSVRASSLSNLGELCQRLDYSLGPLVQELSSCLTALIKTDREAEVRRAAVHVIVLLLRGLSSKTTEVLADVLLDLYRTLKFVARSDPDEVTLLHAQLALQELDDMMRSLIFPQQKLEKKIVVMP